MSRAQRLLALARSLKEQAEKEEKSTYSKKYVMTTNCTQDENTKTGNIKNNNESCSYSLPSKPLELHNKKTALFQWPQKLSHYENSNNVNEKNSDAMVSFLQPISNETKSSTNGFDFVLSLFENLDYEKLLFTKDKEIISSNESDCLDFPEWENSDDSVKDPDFHPINSESQSCSEEEMTTFGAQLEKALLTPKNKNKKKKRQMSRNRGEVYETQSGNVINARSVEQFGTCRNKCHTKVPFEKIQFLFEHYWSLGFYDQRILYIGNLLVINQKKCNTLVNSSRKRNRENTVKYFLEYDGIRINVCRKHFTQCFSETESFIKSVISKKNQCPLLPFKDCRGKGPPVNKISLQIEEEVRQHINKFPAYESHYCRRDTSKKYLHGSLNLATMHRMYKDEVEKPVSLTKYSEIFHTMNLKFKAPKLDTCSTCDTFLSKINIAQNDDERKIWTDKKNAHTDKGEFGFEQKRIDKKNAKENRNMKAFAFDLQQCLPTPFLRNSVSFYKRQLWTFNLTIHDLETNLSGCFMWHESIARRGGNEASCLYKHLKSLPPTASKITFYSDSCMGQNKNSHVAAMFLIFLRDNSTIEYIDHKFLEPGHTHMECDTDHALIERKKKKSNVVISVPRDWYQFIDGINSKLKVFEMEHTDFFNFYELSKKNFNWKRSNLEGEKFVWNSVRWIRYTSNFNQILYKTSLNPEEPFKILSLTKRGTSFSTEDLKTIEELPNISVEKKILWT